MQPIDQALPSTSSTHLGLDPELVASCAARGELFNRCFAQYAQAMNQITDALDQYQGMLTNGPRWVQS